MKAPGFSDRRSFFGMSSAENGDLLMYSRTIALVALVCAAPVTDAAEVTLKFRLVTTDASATMLPVKEVAGRTIGAHDAVGVAVFEDGRLAFKRFVYTEDGTENEGNAHGYSTYTFENGDSLSAKFDTSWGAQGLQGTYQVLSGTGGYAGATGTGSFGTTTFPWEGANRFDGSFTLELPGT
jgi:hypothetical protein